MKLKLLSLNVKGIREKVKRRAIFRWVKRQKADIAFLQESFSIESDADVFKNEWGRGQIFMSYGSSHSRGCVVLIRDGLDITINNLETHREGRYVIIDTTIYNENYLICNVYAPNKDNHQVHFFDSLEQKILSWNAENIIIGGDFNTVFNRRVDRISASKTKNRIYKGREQLLKPMSILELIDIWRKRNPKQRKFTFRN